MLGSEPDLSVLPTGGLTDAEVAAAVMESAGHSADRDRVEAFLRVYERELPGSLPRREGRVLPGVLEILEDLHGEEGVHTLLLTGNTREGARAKLTHYGLARFFDDGAFCAGPGGREEIARRALERVEHRAGSPVPPERVFVIGDTPHDIRCGKSIGARTVAVAQGPFSLDELREHEPWEALERLPDPRAFRSLVGLDGSRP